MNTNKWGRKKNGDEFVSNIINLFETSEEEKGEGKIWIQARDVPLNVLNRDKLIRVVFNVSSYEIRGCLFVGTLESLSHLGNFPRLIIYISIIDLGVLFTSRDFVLHVNTTTSDFRHNSLSKIGNIAININISSERSTKLVFFFGRAKGVKNWWTNTLVDDGLKGLRAP